MSKIVKYCEDCFNKQEESIEYIKSTTGFSIEDINKYFSIGYYTLNNDIEFCPIHKTKKLKNSLLTIEEYETIITVSTELSFIKAMEELKEKNQIEYQLKISQFKASLLQTKVTEEDSNKPHCPTCGSTNIEKISFGKKAFGGAMFGIFSSDVRNTMHCKNCGAKW